MKNKLLLIVLFMQCVGNIYSQDVSFIQQFYGYSSNPYLDDFIKYNLPENASQEDLNIIVNYYTQNKRTIITSFDKEVLLPIWRGQRDVEKKKAEKFVNAVSTIVQVAVETTPQIIANIEQQKAIEKQEEAIRKEEQRAQLQAMMAQNKQKYAEFQAMSNTKVYSSDSQSNTSSYTTQGSYNDLLTSDPNWNKQVQMMVQQYGVEKTREIVKQKQANDYRQSIQSSNSSSYNQSVSEKTISAVTSNRQQIKIKVRGNSVIAYSNGLDQVGKQNWISVVPGAGISRTGAGSLYSTGNLNKEFSYTANVNGTQIYFDL